MAKKLAFSPPQCECGCDLIGKKADVAGMKGNIPMGYCPDCGKAHPLVSSVVREPEPEPEIE